MRSAAIRFVATTMAALPAIATSTCGPLPPAHFFAASGDGEKGAFGAGLLVGRTANGSWPEFNIVTGISTGALTAPFGYLGPEYDGPLQEIYTEISAKDVLRRRWVFAAIFGDAMAINRSLRRTIARYVTPALLEGIARKYQIGRLLLIATTDLDAGRPVIWNVGKLAAIARPGVYSSIRRNYSLMRSASKRSASFMSSVVRAWIRNRQM